MTKLRLLDLFSGIGGFSLGLERSCYFETVAFCEIEPFPRRVLAKHWPEVPCYHDIRELTGDRLVRDGIAVDAICGGFPCQDISFAGLGAGIDGARSGLWSEYARLIGEIRPAYVIVENVSALLGRGLGRVLGDLAAIGYDAEWNCIPASAVGAPHRRDRLWIVAYPQHGRVSLGRGVAHLGEDGAGRERILGYVEEGDDGQERTMVANTENATGNYEAGGGEGVDQNQRRSGGRPKGCGPYVADANWPRLERWGIDRLGSGEWTVGADGRSVPGEWIAEPDVGRVAHGVPSRVDRLKGLGNAVVPQIPEIIGKAIGEYERDKLLASVSADR